MIIDWRKLEVLAFFNMKTGTIFFDFGFFICMNAYFFIIGG